MLPPWLKPPDGARRITFAIRSICSCGTGSVRNARCMRRCARMSRNSMCAPYKVARMRFDGRTALVTGGARGIGAATAALLAREGATVVVADFVEAAAQETAASIGGHSVRCDVTNRDEVEAAVDAAVSNGGSLDILVTCAGIIRDNMLFKMTDDDWDAVIDTHLKGTFHAVRAAQKQMVEQKAGKMVLISSTSALGNRGQTNYSTAKAGLQGMTKTLAMELGPF